jgi:hypothetical protein
MRIPTTRAAVAAAALVAAVPATAVAATTASIQASFSPNKKGKATHIAFTVTDTNTLGGVPAPSSMAVIHLPQGLKIATKGFATCSKATLLAKGPAGCPAGSKVGSGSSLLQAPLGATVIPETAAVTAFVGSASPSKIEFYASGTTPISAQLVLEGTYSASAETLSVPIPAIPTIPGAPNASIQTFSVTVGGSAKPKKPKNAKKVNLVTEPKTCHGAFKWSGDFTYADGETSTATTTSPC